MFSLPFCFLEHRLAVVVSLGCRCRRSNYVVVLSFTETTTRADCVLLSSCASEHSAKLPRTELCKRFSCHSELALVGA